METENREALQSFTDRLGTRWVCELNVGIVKRVKKYNGIDLIDPETKGIERLYTSPVDLADTLYLICQEQAQRDGVSDEEFGDRLGGEAIEHATQALINAIIFFSPKFQREPIKKLIQKMEVYQEKLEANALAWLDRAEVENEIERLAKAPLTLGKSLGSSPASSRSTRIP